MDWVRVVVATLARGLIATLLGLALWAAAPAVIGWHPTTVMTGSMEPRLHPGDVVVSRPVAPSDIRIGQVLLADDPDQPGHLRLHRYVHAGAEGALVTKGDANPQRDSTTIERSAVHGVGFLRIPFVGTPIVWLRDGAWPKVGLLVAALAALLALSAVDGALRRRVDEDPADDDPDDGPVDDPDDGLEARLDPAKSLPPVSAPLQSRRTLRRRARRVRRVRRLGGAGAVLVVAAVVGVLASGQAFAAPWTKTTSTTASLHAGTAPSATSVGCANANGSVTLTWHYAGDTPLSFTVLDDTGTVLATTPNGTTLTATVKLSAVLTLGTTRTLTVRTNYIGNWTANSTNTVNVKVVSILGVLTGTSCA